MYVERCFWIIARTAEVKIVRINKWNSYMNARHKIEFKPQPTDDDEEYRGSNNNYTNASSR